MNDSKTLKECAKSIYGPRWKTELSRKMDVNLITVKRWAKGISPVPEPVWAQLMVDASLAMKTIMLAAKERGVPLPTLNEGDRT